MVCSCQLLFYCSKLNKSKPPKTKYPMSVSVVLINGFIQLNYNSIFLIKSDINTRYPCSDRRKKKARFSGLVPPLPISRIELLLPTSHCKTQSKDDQHQMLSVSLVLNCTGTPTSQN